MLYSRNGGSTTSINSAGKKRRAPIPPKRAAPINPPVVGSIPEESPRFVQRSETGRGNVISPAPAPRTSLETGVRPLSDVMVRSTDKAYISIM